MWLPENSVYLDIYLGKKFLLVRFSWTRDGEKLGPGQLQLIKISQLMLHAFFDTQKQMLFKTCIFYVGPVVLQFRIKSK